MNENTTKTTTNGIYKWNEALHTAVEAGLELVKSVAIVGPTTAARTGLRPSKSETEMVGRLDRGRAGSRDSRLHLWP